MRVSAAWWDVKEFVGQTRNIAPALNKYCAPYATRFAWIARLHRMCVLPDPDHLELQSFMEGVGHDGH